MNAEQIRAEMAEVIARDLVRAESGNIDPADRHYNMAESALDALAAAGLLPTDARWKTSGEAGDTPGWFPSREAAASSWELVQKQCARMCEDWEYEAPTFKREYTTGWQEVAE